MELIHYQQSFTKKLFRKGEKVKRTKNTDLANIVLLRNQKDVRARATKGENPKEGDNKCVDFYFL